MLTKAPAGLFAPQKFELFEAQRGKLGKPCKSFVYTYDIFRDRSTMGNIHGTINTIVLLTISSTSWMAAIKDWCVP